MSRTHSRLGLTALALAGVVALSACGGAQTPADTPAASATPNDETLRVLTPGGPASLDPFTQQVNGAAAWVFNAILEPLVRRGADGAAVPALATEWERIDDTTWEFTLRENVSFQDGSAFDAEDVIASFNQVIERAGSPSSLFKGITASSSNPSTVTFTSEASIASLDELLMFVYILPSEVATMETPDLIGTGPFSLAEWRRGDRLLLDRYEDYWDGPAISARVEMREITETATKVNALRNGETDLIVGLPWDQLQTLESVPTVNIETAPSYQMLYIWLYSSESRPDNPLASAEVRKALWHAIDWAVIGESLYGPSAQIATAPIASAVPGSADLPPYEYDPEKARELLADAGYPDGFDTSIDFQADFQTLAQTVISNLADVGVTVQPQLVEGGVYADRREKGLYDMHVSQNITFNGVPAWTLDRLYTCVNETRLGYCNAAVDAALLAARQADSEAAAQEALTEAQELLWGDAPVLWGLQLPATYAMSTDLRNVPIVPSLLPRLEDVEVVRQ